MIEIVKSGKYASGYAICERCDCEFKYSKDDVKKGEIVSTTRKSRTVNKFDYVVCPECANKIEISSQQVVPTKDTEETEKRKPRCTYVRDKNSMMLYEGDKVKTKYGRVVKIVWKSTPCFIGFDMEPLETEHHSPDEYDLWASENLELVN